MAIQSYLDDEQDDKVPYTSIASREPLEDVGIQGILSSGGDADESDGGDDVADVIPSSQAAPASSPRDLIKNTILQRQASSLAGRGQSTDLMSDPLMQSFKQDASRLQAANDRKSQSDLLANLGQAFQSFSRGASDPKDTPLFENMAKQNAEDQKNAGALVDRKNKVMLAIEARRAKEGATANTANYHQQVLDLMRQKFEASESAKGVADKTKQGRLDSLNIGRANSIMHDPALNKEVVKLNAAGGVQSLIDDIRDGKITDSKNIRTQLTNMIAQIELGATGGEADRQSMGVNNLYTKLQDALSFVTSSPNSTIPPKYIDQLESESHALGDRAAKNYHVMTKSMLEGADLSGGSPDVDPGQVHQLLRQRRDKFLSLRGYEPETGERKLTLKDESTFPKQVRKNGKVATVSNQKELDEARAEDWK